MNLREGLFGGIGVAIGAVAMYFVLDRIHEKELDELYNTIDIMSSDAKTATAILDDYIVEEDIKTTAKRLSTMYMVEDDIVVDADTDGDDGGEGEEGVEDESPDEEEDEVEMMNIYDGIYIIPNTEVGDRVVVGTYKHDTGALEIDEKMSVKNDFDEIIENDALFSLINEEAYDILMSSEPNTTSKVRVLAVRNGVINLDFAIVY